MPKRKEEFKIKADPKVLIHYEGKNPAIDEPDEVIEMGEREINVSSEQVEELFRSKGE